MFDLKWIRKDPKALDAGLARRGEPAVAAEIVAMDERHRAIITQLQTLQAHRNDVSRRIAHARKSGGDALEHMAETASIKAKMAALEQDRRALGDALDDSLLALPNVPDADVPDGGSEECNVEIRKWGEPRAFDFQPKEHGALGHALDMMDFEGAAKLSGSRFVTLKHRLARLSRALGQFMLDLHIERHGYMEINPPVLVHDAPLIGAGQLPKFSQDLFRTEQGHWLIPTAEVALTNIVAGDILEPSALPMRLTAHTLCFRSEAGAAGKDTHGMIRQHQFEKVELVSITRPEESDAELSRMVNCAEEVLKRLDLPYRVMALCAGDMGFAARRAYDIEVWLPGQGRYREISSCSNTGDFQARRMKARFRSKGETRAAFVHTLNGSGVAIGRCLIAVMENRQREDGSIVVPKALRSYMGGLDVIRAAA